MSDTQNMKGNWDISIAYDDLLNFPRYFSFNLFCKKTRQY